MARDPGSEAQSDYETKMPGREWTVKAVLMSQPPCPGREPIQQQDEAAPIVTPVLSKSTTEESSKTGELSAGKGRIAMRCHWEKLGVLGPIYSLTILGLSDHAIADRLNVSEETVQGCISWLLRFLRHQNREELILAASLAQGKWGLSAT